MKERPIIESNGKEYGFKRQDMGERFATESKGKNMVW